MSDEFPTTVPDWLRWKIWERDDFRCLQCGVRRFLTIDHIIPQSLGGSSHERNLRTLCRSCNSSRGNRLEYQEMEIAGVIYRFPDVAAALLAAETPAYLRPKMIEWARGWSAWLSEMRTALEERLALLECGDSDEVFA
jgi:hypothetical protein